METSFIEQELGHGMDFLNPRLHKFLHYVKWTRENKNKDSFDYEQIIIKLSQLLAVIDPSSFYEEELYHYMLGHHKEDVEEALKYLSLRDQMIPRSTMVEQGYNTKTIIKDKNPYLDGYQRPWLSQGYMRNLRASYDEPQDTRLQAKMNDVTNSYYGRPGYAAYVEDEPLYQENGDMTEERYEKLMGNEYLRMLLNKAKQNKGNLG
jgi:hypothetical protein